MNVCQLIEPDIDTIINYCIDLPAGYELEILGFGRNNDLVLYIQKDELYKDRDYANLVRISTKQNGKWVDDTEDIYVSDGSLYRELNRINSYKKFCTL